MEYIFHRGPSFFVCSFQFLDCSISKEFKVEGLKLNLSLAQIASFTYFLGFKMKSPVTQVDISRTQGVCIAKEQIELNIEQV